VRRVLYLAVLRPARPTWLRGGWACQGGYSTSCLFQGGGWVQGGGACGRVLNLAALRPARPTWLGGGWPSREVLDLLWPSKVLRGSAGCGGRSTWQC
jgi:hypothetical protein